MTLLEANMTITTNTLFKLDYGGKIEREIARLITGFDENNFDTGRYPKRWLALKLLEADAEIVNRVKNMPNGEQIIALARQGAEHVSSMLGDDFDLLTADRRYGYINGIAPPSPTALTTSSHTSGSGCPSSSR
jgi:Fe2+ transport system protein B